MTTCSSEFELFPFSIYERMNQSIVFFLLTTVLAVVAEYATPPPTFEAKQFTTWHKVPVQKSRRADIHVDFTGSDGTPDYVDMTRLDLVGNVYERGYAHGYLMAKGLFCPACL
jgi:hypothetical protein